MDDYKELVLKVYPNAAIRKVFHENCSPYHQRYFVADMCEGLMRKALSDSTKTQYLAWQSAWEYTMKEIEDVFSDMS